MDQVEVATRHANNGKATTTPCHAGIESWRWPRDPNQFTARRDLFLIVPTGSIVGKPRNDSHIL
jgi:hypothetical protein